MAKNRPVPASVLARLHGKGSMSEILNIERERLRQQSEAEMQKQLGVEQAEPALSSQYLPSNLPGDQPPNQPVVLPTNQSIALAPGASAPILKPTDHATYPPAPRPTNPPAMGTALAPQRLTEGLSARSRFVGEILPGLPPVTVHTSESITNAPGTLPQSLVAYYRHNVHPGLPFQSQRHLLDTLCHLTLAYGTEACQITLDLLAAASGIRNVKTLRKWLNNLHDKDLIRYTPVHGDPRGSVILLTPPPGAPDSRAL